MAYEMVEVQKFERRPLPTARDLAAVLFRQRRVILGTFLTVLAVVLASGIWTKKYEAQTKILVLRQRADSMVTAGADVPQQVSAQVAEEDLNSEVELIRSDDILRKVVIENGLQYKAKGLFGNRSNEAAIESAVQQLGKTLNIEPVRKTNVIAVKYQSSDPRLASSVLNSVAAAYLEKHREVHRPSGEFVFFDQQTARFRDGLEKAQDQLAEFTQKNGVVSAQLERDLTLQRLADFEATAHQAQASAVETEQRIKSLQAELQSTHPRLITSVKTGENPQLMGQLKSTLLTLELKRTELLTKYDPTFRLVQEVDKQIADTKTSIATEESKPPKEETTDQDPTYAMLRSELAKAEADLTGMKARATAMTLVAGEYRADARSLEQEGIRQDNLQQNAKTEQDNYLLYQRKREEARISDALDRRGILNVAMIEQPVTPSLPARSPVKTAGLSLLLACFMSLGVGFVADYAAPSFRTPDEVVGYLEIPVLASLPKGR